MKTRIVTAVDANEGYLANGFPRPAQQHDVSVKADNSPQACAMQRLVGHQRTPMASA